MPVRIQVTTAPRNKPQEINTSNLNTLVSIKVKPNTSNKPKIPPSTQRKALSIKNSLRMVLRLAPIAFFNPMILVRSRTVTNMIFATPKIPTMKESMVMAIPPIVIPLNMEAICVVPLLTSFNAKLSSCLGFKRRTPRITPRNSFLRSVTGTFSRPFTIINPSLLASLPTWLANR